MNTPGLIDVYGSISSYLTINRIIYVSILFIIILYIYSLPQAALHYFFWIEVWCGVVSNVSFYKKLVNPFVTIRYIRVDFGDRLF